MASRDESSSAEWDVEITRDGLPGLMPWWWWVRRKRDYASRGGFAFTKRRAERAAVRARLSIERDDVRIEL